MNAMQIIFDWFKEALSRVKTKSPAFFKVLILIGASLTLAGYIPSMLQQWFSVMVSGKVIHVCEMIAHYATGFLMASGLTTTPPAVGQTVEGSAVKVTDEKAMPFTARAEKKAIAKEVPPPEILPDVPEKEKIDLSNVPYSAPGDATVGK